MATAYLDPNTTESTAGWTGTAPHHEQVDDGTDPPTAPATTTFITGPNGSSNIDVYGMNDIAGGYSATVIAVYIYAKTVAPSQPLTSTIDVSVNGGAAWLGAKAINYGASGTPAWNNTANWTGTWTDLSGLQVKITESDPTATVTVYEITALVTYTATATASGKPATKKMMMNMI